MAYQVLYRTYRPQKFEEVVGQEYLDAALVGKKYVERDVLENMLPINDTNLILLRQLMKLRIFSKNVDGSRKFYSPFYASLFLLLNNETIDKDDFISITQGINPYLSFESIVEKLKSNDISSLLKEVIDIQIDTPIEFLLPGLVSETSFNSKIKKINISKFNCKNFFSSIKINRNMGSSKICYI